MNLERPDSDATVANLRHRVETLRAEIKSSRQKSERLDAAIKNRTQSLTRLLAQLAMSEIATVCDRDE